MYQLEQKNVFEAALKKQSKVHSKLYFIISEPNVFKLSWLFCSPDLILVERTKLHRFFYEIIKFFRY